MNLLEFYQMVAGESPDIVEPGENIMALKPVCLTSAFQLMDRKPISVEIVPPERTVIFPDFILYQSIPLISDKFYHLLQRMEVDYLFYKPVLLTWTEECRSEPYFLALPPRLRCLDMEKSIFAEADDDEPLKDAERMVIRTSSIGRYEIFKVADVVNQEIIVTKSMKCVLEKENLENLFFYELEE